MITKNIKSDYDISGTNKTVICGLSTDTKPTDETIQNGDEFREMDTKKTYLYDAENAKWREWLKNNEVGT